MRPGLSHENRFVGERWATSFALVVALRVHDARCSSATNAPGDFPLWCQAPRFKGAVMSDAPDVKAGDPPQAAGVGLSTTGESSSRLADLGKSPWVILTTLLI